MVLGQGCGDSFVGDKERSESWKVNKLSVLPTIMTYYLSILFDANMSISGMIFRPHRV